MQYKLFQKFLTNKAGAFGNKIEKELQKPHPELKKYICLQSNANGSFLQKCINFVEQTIQIFAL